MHGKGKQSVITKAGVLLGSVFMAGSAHAGGGGGCYYSHSLENATSPCGNTAAMAPGNDTRVNLNFLLRDARGLQPVPAKPPPREWWDEYRTSHFGFGQFRRAYWSEGDAPDEPYSLFSGTRCQSLERGDAAFAAAVEAAAGVSASDRRALGAARGMLAATCEGKTSEPAGGWPALRGTTGTAREFLVYLLASNAFYGGDWDAARSRYAALASATDPWVRETAQYMLARVDINAATDGAFGRWGDFEGTTPAGREAAARAGEGFRDYLSAYPDGRYAASAQGLQRRAMWLSGQDTALALTYSALLRALDPSDPVFRQLLAETGRKWAAVDRLILAGRYAGILEQSGLDGEGFPGLLDEVDNKLIMRAQSGGELLDPLLIATWDLQHMRRWDWGDTDISEQDGLLGAADLAAQEPLFAGHEDLFGFLLASHAYYVTGDHTRVLELIPDAARQERFDALQFSRQVLRGMALARRGDRNEAGFWLDMLGGADPVLQRPLVELGLAVNYERNGKLDAVFAPDSPITDPEIRHILLRESAGPDILRATARNSRRPMDERRTALRALLWKELSRGRYADFVSDHALLAGFAKDAPQDPETYMPEQFPLDEFRSGTWSQHYRCPNVKATAATLARNPKDNSALLCLGEFYRLNGFDFYGEYYGPRSQFPETRHLGDGPEQFPGETIPRARFYEQVIADPRASADDRAYALYRAVWCYGPSGNNDCGGEDVPQSRRKAWFERLKREYAGSRWARELEYYW